MAREVLSGRLSEYIQGVREAHSRQKEMSSRNAYSSSIEEDRREKIRAKELILRLKAVRSQLGNGKLFLTVSDRFELAKKTQPELQRSWQKTSGFKERWKPFYMSDYSQYGSGVESDDQELWKNLTEANSGCVRVNNDGVCEIDIQNISDPGQLPLRWKIDNLKTAVDVANEVFSGTPVAHLTPEFLDYKASVIHQYWLDRNGKGASESQQQPFAKLSELDKNKDRDPIVITLETYFETQYKKKNLP